MGYSGEDILKKFRTFRGDTEAHFGVFANIQQSNTWPGMTLPFKHELNMIMLSAGCV